VFAGAVAQVEGLRGLLVGGRQDDVERMRRTVKENDWRNIEVVGHVSPSEVPFYQVAADILVLPNSAQAEISRSYTSPLKLFEYMAAERPIIASDLPSLREVLNEDNALLVTPDDANALAAALRQLLADPALGQRLAHHARRDVEAYSWRARAEQILKQTIA
jgi:glycosyltransferase involved in cell wall biosynthesis